MGAVRPAQEGDDRRCLAAPSLAVAGPAAVAAQLERLVVQARRARTRFALVWVSVAAIDDGSGAPAAELERRVREDVAQRVSGRVRSTDCVLRESERDACVLLPGATEESGRRVAARFLRALEGDYRVDDALVRVQVRVGSAGHPGDGTSAGELLRKAAS